MKVPRMRSEEFLVSVLHRVRESKGLGEAPLILPISDLRRDLGLDSLDLAELAVRVQDHYGVDVFAAGVIRTWGELIQRVEEHRGRES